MVWKLPDSTASALWNRLLWIACSVAVVTLGCLTSNIAMLNRWVAVLFYCNKYLIQLLLNMTSVLSFLRHLAQFHQVLDIQIYLLQHQILLLTHHIGWRNSCKRWRGADNEQARHQKILLWCTRNGNGERCTGKVKKKSKDKSMMRCAHFLSLTIREE